MNAAAGDTIVAVATAPGVGGVGVVRVSGPLAHDVARKITGRSYPARRAVTAEFRDAGGELIDSGLVLCFDAGASYTGEAIAEFQGHGSPVALQLVVQACLQSGARLANPGEFTERAFENGKLDLAQAEAVLDLINSGSAAAAKGAVRSLVGEFSTAVHSIADELLRLRVYLEADIDFPDEEVDALADGEVARQLGVLEEQVDGLLRNAQNGVRLASGATVAIVGAPNAGKSSLLNALARQDTAIVTDIPGTTRDVLKVDLVLGGLPVQLVDTAGLREATDIVEQEGVRRALQELHGADLVIYLRDGSDLQASKVAAEWLAEASELLEVINKADLMPNPEGAVSARTGEGLEELVQTITGLLGFQPDASAFTARQRHVHALEQSRQLLGRAREMAEIREHSELIAEEVRLAHGRLGEIVGEVTSDALLGEIFSAFCIGK